MSHDILAFLQVYNEKKGEIRRNNHNIIASDNSFSPFRNIS